MATPVYITQPDDLSLNSPYRPLEWVIKSNAEPTIKKMKCFIHIKGTAWGAADNEATPIILDPDIGEEYVAVTHTYALFTFDVSAYIRSMDILTYVIQAHGGTKAQDAATSHFYIECSFQEILLNQDLKVME